MRKACSRQFSSIRKLTIVLTAVLITAASATAAEIPRVRVLILTGESDYPYHDWHATTAFLKDLLEKTGRFDVHAEEEVRGITSSTLNGYDVLLLNYNGPRWGSATEKAIEQFVAGGKGMFALHGVSYGQFFGMEFKEGKWAASSDPGWVVYPAMIGSTWKAENIGHAQRGIFTVRWTDREHPISRGLDGTFLADDELYHRLDLRSNVHVLAVAWSDPKVGGTGKDEPVIWTVPFGQGRVVQTIFGHDTASMYQPGFSTLFCRSVEWAATGAVTLPARIELGPTPRADAVRVLVVTGGHDYPVAFYTLFEGYDDIRWTHACSREEAFYSRLSESDVVVLHDMHEQIGEKERGYLRDFVEKGGGVVSTHHAIVDYTSWPWWYEEVVGGKFFTQADGTHEKSDYKDDVSLIVRPVKSASGHPILRGVGPLAVVDEAYRGMWFSPGITPIMETESPYNDRPVVYIGPHPKARVVYIQLGHGESTMRNPAYRKLIHNAILWTAHGEQRLSPSQ